VRLRIRYKPDQEEARTDILDVNPSTPLQTQVAAYMDGVSKRFRFYRRTARKFRLKHGHRNLHLGRSLRAQGIESGIDVTLEPRLILRWPPGKAAITIATLVLSAIIGAGGWLVYVRYLRTPPVVETFYVKFVSDVNCTIASSDTTFALEGAKPRIVALRSGAHEFDVIPVDFPIFGVDMNLVGEGAKVDSVSQRIEVASRFGNTEKIKLAVGGYVGALAPENRLLRPVSINGRPRDVDNFGSLVVELVRGEYEIKYDGMDRRLEKVEFDSGLKVLRPAPFRFDFSQFEGSETYLTFLYFPESP
jgi:hypothetical protein